MGARSAGGLALVLALAALAPSPADAGAPCEPFLMPGVGLVCEAPDGLYEVFARDGLTSLGFVHGPDPLPSAQTLAAMEAAAPAAAPRNPACVANPATDGHMVVVYARASNDQDRYVDVEPQLRSLIQTANGRFYARGVELGRGVDYAVRCTDGVMEIRHEVLPTPLGGSSFDSIVSDLRARGYTATNAKTWVFFDDNAGCPGCAGVGHIYGDSRPGAENTNNQPFEPMFAVDFGYLGAFGVTVLMHENGHNQGAVQNSAPFASGGFHCNDGVDVMCYADGGSTSRYTETRCPGSEVWDCGADSYFNPIPPPGSWLDTHWNLASSVNRFVRFDVPDVPNEVPVMTSIACTPSTSDRGQTVSCAFTAADDSPGLNYDVDWGDGTRTRVPGSAWAPPGVAQTASHVWTIVGNYTATATARDNGAPQLRSSPLTALQSVLPSDNAPPTVRTVTCPPVRAGAATACEFVADDDSSRLRFDVAWGDGSTGRAPTSGTVAPGIVARASHAFSLEGTYLVETIAVDDGASPRSSATHFTTVTVLPCAAVSTGSLSAGLLGQQVEGLSSRTHPAFAPQCAGLPWTLSGDAADFEVCWLTATDVEIGCAAASGRVPDEARKARVVMTLGFPSAYRLEIGDP